MRVLIAGNVGESLPPPYAGIPKRALLLAKEIREHGHACALVFEYAHDKPDDLGACGTYFFNYDAKPGRKEKVVTILRRAVSQPFLFISLLFAFFRAHHTLPKEAFVSAGFGVLVNGILREWKPDVILCESALARSFFTLKVAALHGVPAVIDTYAEVHDASILKLPGGEACRSVYWKAFLSQAQTIVAPSYYCAAGPQMYAPEKVKVIYAGIEFEKYANHPVHKVQAREYFKIPQDVFCAIAVGALSPRKGHDHLIEALCRPGNEHVAALICGPGDSTWLRDLARQRGVEGRVRFFSGLSEHDLIALYRAADVYVDASNTPRACLGMSVTEAMAVGMPVVSYRVGGLPEIVHDGANGYLVPLDDIEELGRALARVAALPKEQYDALSKEGARLASDLVDVKKTSERMMEVLQDAALQRRGGVL